MERIGRMCVWPIGINQIRVEHRRRRISLYVAVPEQGCTSCERGRVVMGRLKRMIVTVSSSSRLPVSARVPETDCHVSDLIIPFSGFLFGQLLINGSVFAKTSIKVRFQLTRGSGPENV